MKRVLPIFLLMIGLLKGTGQSADTLFVNFNIQPPFATYVDNKPGGIEVDIINEYILWLKTNKKMDVIVKYTPFTDFDFFYASVKKGSKNTIGLGSITVTTERMKEVDFTASYIKNVAFCITNGNAPDIKVKSKPELIKNLGSMTALTMGNTSLSKHVAELKKLFLPDLKITILPNQSKILDEIAKNVLNFGYVDALEFWFYLKANPQKFLKMQKVLNVSKEEFAFMLPKGSPHKALFNEFFASPTGYKTNRNYRATLEKYIGSYMTQNMAIN